MVLVPCYYVPHYYARVPFYAVLLAECVLPLILVWSVPEEPVPELMNLFFRLPQLGSPVSSTLMPTSMWLSHYFISLLKILILIHHLETLSFVTNKVYWK
jgi:hypothetical protein